MPMKMGFLFCESAKKEKRSEQGQPTRKKMLFRRLPTREAGVRKQTKHVVSLLLVKPVLVGEDRKQGREGIVIEVVEQCHDGQHQHGGQVANDASRLLFPEPPLQKRDYDVHDEMCDWQS